MTIPTTPYTIFVLRTARYKHFALERVPVVAPAMMKRFLEDIDSPNVEVILDSVNLIHPDEVERQEEDRKSVV